MKFKNIDTTGLTPEQLANAELMAEYTQTQDIKRSFATTNLAEEILPSLLHSDHRPAPVDAFALALKYAEHAHAAGEAYMQKAFEDWKASRPADPSPEPEAVDDIEDLDDNDVNVVPDGELDINYTGVDALHLPENVDINHTETITRDDALADTERRDNELNASRGG